MTIDTRRVAVCAPHFNRFPAMKAELLSRYPNACFTDHTHDLLGDALLNHLQGCELAITAAEILNDQVFAAVPELRVVSKIGVGLDSIDLSAMARHDVKLGWTAGVNKRSVAELALGGMLSALRKIPQVGHDLRRGVWLRQMGHTLSGKTVGIIGCGQIGQEVIRLLAPFGCRVLVHDIRSYPEFYAEHGVEAVDLNTVLCEANVVSLHVPLTNLSRNMIDAKALAAMRPGAVLVNTARGGIVDEVALRQALESGQLGAAAFDVWACEPCADLSLLTLPNVIATTHMGASTHEALHDMLQATIDNLATARLPDASWLPGLMPEVSM